MRRGSPAHLGKPQLGPCFGKEDIFWFGPAIEQFLDAREGSSSRQGARLNGVAGAFEIVPGEMLHIGPQHQVGMTLPRFKLVFLRRAHSASDNLKDVFRRAVTAVLDSNGNAQNALGANLARGYGGDLRDEAAVGKAARTDFDWLEQTGKRATRTDGIGQTSLRKDDGIERGQVCGDNGHRNP